MRLFIAINFDEETKKRLLDIQQKLKDNSKSGNFSRPENLHLTIQFLGEINGDISAIKSSIDKCFNNPIDLEFSGTGKFRSNLHWIGIKQNPQLIHLYNSTYKELKRAGYKLDENESFSPHITIAREVELKSKPDLSFDDFTMHATCLSLMKSERINGKLTYTEIYRKSIV